MASARRTLLLIDDDEPLCLSLSDALGAPDLEVLTARTGSEGIEVCRGTSVDVVVLDQKLPDTEGHTLCRPILDANEKTKIIFVTGYPSFDNALRAIKAGAFDYLSKPFEFEQLRLSVERCLTTLRLEHTERLHEYRRVIEGDATVLVGSGGGFSEVARVVDVAASTDAPVLITGETGSGKGVVARAIHFRSSRRRAEVTILNCAALPESLIEAELFGHEKGAFTGATIAREGVFEMADGGTLVLDEIGDMPLGLQTKLLHVLEEKTVRRLGSKLNKRVDFRLIATTNADLESAVKKGSFRSDLYYRLDVLRIHVPPLRERPGEIPGLCAHFLERMAPRGSQPSLPAEELARLASYPWPGNVRELRKILERALLLQKEGFRPSAFLAGPAASPVRAAAPPEARAGLLTLREAERRHVALALAASSGNLSRSARALGVSLSTLKRKARSYGLTPARSS